jgi:hypothetical protein
MLHHCVTRRHGSQWPSTHSKHCFTVFHKNYTHLNYIYTYVLFASIFWSYDPPIFKPNFTILNTKLSTTQPRQKLNFQFPWQPEERERTRSRSGQSRHVSHGLHSQDSGGDSLVRSAETRSRHFPIQRQPLHCQDRLCL